MEKEEKLRKEVEALNAKLLEEKTKLLASLEGEKGSLGEIQQKAAKLQAQKNDLESQLSVSSKNPSISQEHQHENIKTNSNLPADIKILIIPKHFKTLLSKYKMTRLLNCQHIIHIILIYG